MLIIYIMIFAFLGGMARYGLSQLLSLPNFPMGNLTANLLGCLFLALFVSLLLKRLRLSEQVSTGITVGFFGAFTTFSSFTMDFFHLLQQGNWLLAGFYFLLSSIGGFLLTGIGLWLGGTFDSEDEHA